MLFNSISFLVFFPIVVFVYFLIPHKIRYIWLLFCSYYFYMCWNASYALLILTSTVITYVSGLALDYIRRAFGEEEKRKRIMKWCVLCSFVCNLGILGYFKYCDFFIKNINMVLSKAGIQIVLPNVDILLPVGISFYTFQALSYTMDVYRGEVTAEKNFLKYALFVSFFPQLVAGPIERSGKLLKQLDEKHYWDYERVWEGILLMIWGYFLKIVLADRIAVLVDTVYGNVETYGGTYIIVATVLFAVQIYGDFAGYSTIALGAAKIMGFELTDNFNAPYFSQNTAEFWQRWHISLFSWFRDYIYIPLGGNRKGKIRKHVNIMIVFLVSGFWHGASWSFIIWGGVNGLYQVIGDLLKPMRDKLIMLLHLKRDCFSHRLLKTIVTFILIDISWVFFRTGRFPLAVQCFLSICRVKNIQILFDDSLFLLGLNWKNFMVMLVAIMILFVADHYKYHGVVIRQMIMKQEWWFRWTTVIMSVVLILIFGIWGPGYNEASFIYFQF